MMPNERGHSLDAQRARPSPSFSFANPVQQHTAHRADILVLGARATSGLTRLLLGSVAQGALSISRTPVLLVR